MLLMWPSVAVWPSRILCSVFPGMFHHIVEGYVRAAVAHPAGYLGLDWMGSGPDGFYGVFQLHRWFMEREWGLSYLNPPSRPDLPEGWVMLPDGYCFKLGGLEEKCH